MSDRRRLLMNGAYIEKVYTIPDEYLQLEYLHFSGTPKFDTGIFPYNDDLTPRGIKITFEIDTDCPTDKEVAFFNLMPAFDRSWYYWLYTRSNTQVLSVLDQSINQFIATYGQTHTLVVSNKNKSCTFDGDTVAFSKMTSTTTHGDGSIPTISLGNYLGWGAVSNYKVYEFQVLNETDKPLSWLVPAMRLSDHALGFWDYIQEIFIENIGRGATITYGFGDYEVLDNIEWVGTGVGFQTGVFYDSSRNIGWDIDFEYITLPTQRSDLLVCMGGSDFAGIQRTNSGVFRNQYNGNYYEPTIVANTRYNIKTTANGEVYINGTQVSTITPRKGYQSYFVLGGWKQGNNQTISTGNFTLNNCKIYRVKLLDSTGRIIDWLPVRKISTSELGFYDIIGEQFIVPQGTTSHLIGNSI